MNPVHAQPLIRRRGLKIFLGVGGLLFLFAVTALHAFPGLFAKFDDPARLGVTVQILTTNGFTLRWAEKIAASNQAGFDLVFVHGSPGGAGVWATQFQTLATNADLFAYDRIRNIQAGVDATAFADASGRADGLAGGRHDK